MTPIAEHPLATAGFFQVSSEADIQRLNTLVGLQRRFPFAWAGRKAALRFTPLQAAPPAGVFLRLRLDDHSIDLGLPHLPEPAMLGVAFAGVEIAALPDELLLGVLEAWLDDAVNALKAPGVALQLEAVHHDTPAAPAAFGWEIALDDESRFLAGTLHAETDALNHLANLAGRIAPRPAQSAGTLPVSLHVVVSSLPLPLATLSTLQAGDVLFPPLASGAHAAGSCELWYRGASLALAQLRKKSLEILTMKASADAKPAPAGNLRVDELPVSVAFDVGQLDLTISQLRTMGTGYTFELPTEAGRLVTIRVNGREIGHGELVEFGEKVGVRIVDWSLA